MIISSDITTERTLDIQRLAVSKMLDKEKRSELGQFMTPTDIADFMASQFDYWPDEINLLDPGAGIGSLTEAFTQQFFQRAKPKSKLSITAYEIEDSLIDKLANNLANLEVMSSTHEVKSDIVKADFILQTEGRSNGFTHIILNPPYKKIPANSKHRKVLSDIGIEAPNLYVAFLALSILHARSGAEIIAIIPRSFCNGTYFRPFREWLLKNVAIGHIYSFESRRSTFKDDNVLQENIIIKLIKDVPQKDVTVTKISGSSILDKISYEVEFTKVVNSTDKESYIRIPEPVELINHSILTHSLEELGLHVSTGPVVDFRATEFLLHNLENESAPLLYPHHFSSTEFKWPRNHKKPNAIKIESATKKLLMPKGWYLIVKRFSSKEEKRRIVANVVSPKNLPFDWYGFENHVNVIHFNKKGISKEIVWGLYIFLNSTQVDNHFRTFSGHTQVNATDLKNMLFPSVEILSEFGIWAENRKSLTLAGIDDFIDQYAKKHAAKSGSRSNPSIV